MYPLKIWFYWKLNMGIVHYYVSLRKGNGIQNINWFVRIVTQSEKFMNELTIHVWYCFSWKLLRSPKFWVKKMHCFFKHMSLSRVCWCIWCCVEEINMCNIPLQNEKDSARPSIVEGPPSRLYDTNGNFVQVLQSNDIKYTKVQEQHIDWSDIVGSGLRPITWDVWNLS